MRHLIPAFLLLMILNGCTVNAIYHDEDKAIESANTFLKALIVEDYPAAYSQILERLKQNLSMQKFESDLKLSREKRGDITKAVFDSFQAVPGQRAIQLYYHVFHQNAGDILYHLVLDGDGRAGYKILILDVGNQMSYPPNMKYRGLNRIKKNKAIIVTAN